MRFQSVPRIFLIVLVLILLLLASACSSTKFVPNDKYLLHKVNITSDVKGVDLYDAKQYIAQKPNFKTFTLFEFPLFLYNLSGRDSTKWVSRTLRKAGEPPVLYDSSKVNKTVDDLTRMMTNKGYLNAQVVPNIKLHAKKADITYNIIGGKPYLIDDYTISAPDSVIEKPDELYLRGLSKSKYRYVDGNVDSLLYLNQLVDKNSIFDLSVLDQERDRITKLLRHTGYYNFNKEYIGFVADTLIGNNLVDLDLIVYPFVTKDAQGNIIETKHKQYIVESVDIYVDYNPIEFIDINKFVPSETYSKDGYTIKYGERGKYIRPRVILANCFIRPGELYNELYTTHTYAALSQLKILKNVNITYNLVNGKLKCIITCVPDKRQGVSTNLEGTNSGGFFGLGAGATYTHRNALKGSEQFRIGLRGAYEMVTPSFTNFDDNYFEIGGETGLTFPRFVLPFLNREFRNTVNAQTQLSAGYTFQRRPGFFTRTIMYTGLKYNWNDRIRTDIKHSVDLIDINYVHLPTVDKTFYDGLSPSAQNYSFSDQFIVGAGYTFTKTNLTSWGDTKLVRKPVYSLRASIESAGNLLYVIAKLAGEERNKDGARELFGTQFAQYIRGTFDYSKVYVIDEKNSFAWHGGFGMAQPYGNYKEIPIQKRFFAGGGNSLRGWSVRSLGPGSFIPTKEQYNNFYYHSGDIKLDLNIEYRSRIFWILELASFIDAGNVWTLKDNPGQNGGQFAFDKFYEQIAVSWGLGLRLDFDFFLLRLDCGWKAFNPAGNIYDSTGKMILKTERWPIKYPWKIQKNTAVHIAVGYPF